MRSMPFLPKEFSSADERSGMFELPPHYVCPLVEQQRQITAGPNPLRKRRIHDSFRSWTNCNRFGQFTLTTFSHPGDLWREALNMILLLVKRCFRHKHWEVTVLNTELFDSSIEELCNLLPNVESIRSEDVASWNFVVLNHLGFRDHLRIPFAKIRLLCVLDTQFVRTRYFSFLFLFNLLNLGLRFWLFNFSSGLTYRCGALF